MSDEPLLLEQAFGSEPIGLKTNAVRWLQKQVMAQSLTLPRHFATREAWEGFRARLRAELPGVIGLPVFPPLGESLVRARLQVGEHAWCERVDVAVDEEYAIPAFVFSPKAPATTARPALVWNPGWPEDKWKPAYQHFALRMVRHGFVVLIP
ncbi:MAG: hypothetical protein IT369_02685, partial [Candidatus Latescibacteria bacterium]|nr:hypothetical protein [Candidatus Latescibacterota bacterium]